MCCHHIYKVTFTEPNYLSDLTFPSFEVDKAKYSHDQPRSLWSLLRATVCPAPVSHFMGELCDAGFQLAVSPPRKNRTASSPGRQRRCQAVRRNRLQRTAGYCC